VTTPHRKPDACGHYQAVQTGSTEAKELPDGKWEYSHSYRCPTCGADFIESHVAGVPNSRRIVIVKK